MLEHDWLQAINIRFRADAKSSSAGGRDIPFKLLVLGDFSAGANPAQGVAERKVVRVTPMNYDEVLAHHNVDIRLSVPDWLTGELGPLQHPRTDSLPGGLRRPPHPQARMSVRVVVRAMRDFSPLHIVQQNEPLRQHLERIHFLRGMRKAWESRKGDGRAKGEWPVDAEWFERLHGNLVEKHSLQLDEILHDPQFQAVEGAWRGLELLLNRTNFGSANRNEIYLLDISKAELTASLHAPVPNNRLLGAIEETDDGVPYGAIIGNYIFGPSPLDALLLQRIADIAQRSHAPFIAAAGPQFWGKDSFSELSSLDVSEVVPNPSWDALRNSGNANYIALTIPRFLLRAPYHLRDNPVEGLEYEERVADDPEKLLWGNACFLFATRLTNSFAKYGWCVHVLGQHEGGAVTDLPKRKGAKGELLPPLEILLSDGWQVANHGLITLMCSRYSTDTVVFNTAYSVQRPHVTPDEVASRNARLGAQLPYLFSATRLAHFVQLLVSQSSGVPPTCNHLQTVLNAWVKQYVSPNEQPDRAVISLRPWHDAKIQVNALPAEPGWYVVEMVVEPHIRYCAQFVQITLVSKLRWPDRFPTSSGAPTALRG